MNTGSFVIIWQEKKYGLADDETMRCAPEPTKSARSYVLYNEKRKSVTVGDPLADDDEDVVVEVPVKLTGNHRRVAERVGTMCFSRIREGASKQEVLKFRDMLLKGYKGGQEVPNDHKAWEACKASGILASCPVVAFDYVAKDESRKFHFQTTINVAGSVLEAERIARLCWAKIDAGSSKEEVLQYRNQLYKKDSAISSQSVPHQYRSQPPATKRRRM